jgi:dihydrodipicolinate synthase/N-acetylneuraminate lyase
VFLWVFRIQIFLVKALFCEANPQPVKKIMELIGKCSATVRAPLVACEPETVAKLTELVKQHNL